jgi:opacity protein-like surface antigen
MHSRDPDANGALKLVAAAAALVVAAFVVLVIAGIMSAKAADAADKGGPSFLPVPGASVAATPWTGFYGSLGFGYSTTDVLGLEIGESTIYTAGAGYDYQFPGTKIVAGVLADYSFTSGASGIAELNGSWFVGVRLGALLSDHLLGYGTVGYTTADFSQAPSNFEGLTLGAGAELLVTKHVSLKVDWRRVDLGSAGFGPLEVTTDELRAFLNYRF